MVCRAARLWGRSKAEPVGGEAACGRKGGTGGKFWAKQLRKVEMGCMGSRLSVDDCKGE